MVRHPLTNRGHSLSKTKVKYLEFKKSVRSLLVNSKRLETLMITQTTFIRDQYTLGTLLIFLFALGQGDMLL